MKKVFLVLVAVVTLFLLVGCDIGPQNSTNGSESDAARTMEVAGTLQQRQPTPTDIMYSMERYNLQRRAYWVNGMQEKARTLPCPIANPPLGYAVILDGGIVIARIPVEGKISSLQNYLTPISEYYEQDYGSEGYAVGDGNDWLSDVDGTYGDNIAGKFWFTPSGQYWETDCKVLYSDAYFQIEDPVLKVESVEDSEKNLLR